MSQVDQFILALFVLIVVVVFALVIVNEIRE